MDYYKTMDIPRDSNQEDIESAYKLLSKKLHPDKAASIIKNNPAFSHLSELEIDKKIKVCIKDMEKSFQNLHQAYTVLSDPKAREYYDAHGTVENKQSAEQKIQQNFIHLLRQAMSLITSPKTDHLINKMVYLINHELKDQYSKKQQLLNNAKKIVAIKKRLSGPAEGIHIDILKTDLQAIIKDIKTVKGNIKDLISLRKMTDEYSYEIDNPESAFLRSFEGGFYPKRETFIIKGNMA